MFIGMLQSPMRDFAYAVKQVSELEDRNGAEAVVAEEPAAEEAVVEVETETAVEETVETVEATEEVAE